jgi:hypothetical protein
MVAQIWRANRFKWFRTSGSMATTIAYVLWFACRLTMLPVMVIIEPLVRAVLAGSALLILLSALLFQFLADSEAPILGMLALSIACILLLRLYYRVLRWLS